MKNVQARFLVASLDLFVTAHLTPPGDPLGGPRNLFIPLFFAVSRCFALPVLLPIGPGSPETFSGQVDMFLGGPGPILKKFSH